MATISHRNTSNPLLIPEIVGLVVNNVHMARDLLSCACVNSIWNVAALKKLYKGSLNDMQFRTPDIGSLNCLFVASRKHFARNMSFVKHLLLSPETPAIDEVEELNIRLVCLEKCRAMRHRQYALLLLRPQGRGLASLTIPFEITSQDWSHISDLLISPSIEFLAIDNYYCELLLTSSQELIGPSFPNLRALTIYNSDSGHGIDELCRLLRSCDLQFFYIEQPYEAENLTQSDAAELMSCLRRQQNLKVMALEIRHCGPSLGEQGIPWPKLKALYIQDCEEDWLDQLPEFEELQILRLKNLVPKPIINRSVIENIAACLHLLVLTIDFGEFCDDEELLHIARCCPLLRKFSVRRINFRANPSIAEDLLLGLLPALPHLEFLELGLKFQMAGAMLQDISRYCPRLTVLDLPETQLCLSLALMTGVHPLWELESMHFRGIYFENPRYLMQQDTIQSLATEWRRVFPKLRGIPCLRDIYSRFMQGDELGEELEGDSASLSADKEMPLTGPRLEFDDFDFDSDWSILRTKLWRMLGYGKDPLIHDKIQYMWQTDLEIETVGWPVVPLAAFSYSTTAKCVW